MNLIEYLLFICRHDIVLDLKKNIWGSINDLVLELYKFSIALILEHVNTGLLLGQFFNKVVHNLGLFTVIGLEAPFESLFNDFDYGSFGASLTGWQTWATIQVIYIKSFSATVTFYLHVFHLRAEFAVFLLYKVLNYFNPWDDDFLEDALALVHFD